MRAFYYLFILFNNLLSIHIHTCGEIWGGGLAPPQAPDERRLCIFNIVTNITDI